MTAALKRRDLIEDRTLRGRAFAELYTDRTEAWLADLYREAAGGSGAIALVALGGQGRRELAPQSDLDLLLLVGTCPDAEAIAERLWYPIWDAGVKLGHAVRTVRDTISLASDDLETATALLSARHLCGDPQLTTELCERTSASWRRKSRYWLETLAHRVDERHGGAGEVAFALEPDLKEGRGGLRDVHALGWAVAAGAALDPDSFATLSRMHDVLFEVRVELHRCQGKAGDRLVLQEQDAVASRLGDADADALMARVAEAGRAIALISDEVWHDIKTTMNGRFFGRFRRDRSVDHDFGIRGARVALVDEHATQHDPFAVLRVAELAAREGLRISAGTLDALRSSPAPPDPWPSDARERFCDLLLAGSGAVPVIEILDQWGLWSRLLPEWGPNRSRPQRNAYHRFTVDRHLLETAAEAAALADRVSRPDLLVMSALLHDICKGYPELGDHSHAGADMARTIVTRMGFDQADVDTVAALVRNHLLMAHVATRRDLDDPKTIEFVASEVGTAGRVALLRALTEADSIATGPSAWSPWKAQLLDLLASRTAAVLGGDEPGAVITGSFPSDDQRKLLDLDGVQIVTEGDTITICCPDRPGVFFRVAGALALHGLNVVEANIHSESGKALDEFRVGAGASAVVPWERVEHDVIKVLEGRLALQARIQERERSHQRRHRVGLNQLVPGVRFDNGEGAATTVVEVVGPDGVGLLYRLARSLAEFNLNVSGARIHTLGDDVVDSFYVTGPDGGRIDDEPFQAEIRRGLLDALDLPA